MKILHTSDLHIGKHIEGSKYSLIEEQKNFLEELVEICDENEIDIVVIAGDIFDNGNPSAIAEEILISSIEKLSNNNKRIVILFPGNHDNPKRLSSLKPLLKDKSIFMYTEFNDVILKENLNTYKILESKENYIRIEIKEETVGIGILPYPSEKRMGEIFSEVFDEETQKDYCEKVREISKRISDNFKSEDVNLFFSHLFVLGGMSTDSERKIELGGSYLIETNYLPQNADYIGLGHLHKPQIVNKEKNIYYSGSPLQYSKSEANQAKIVRSLEILNGKIINIENIELKNPSPIEIWNEKSYTDALNRCKNNESSNAYIFLTIKTNEYLSRDEILELYKYKNRIIEIIPIISSKEEEFDEYINYKDRSILENFKDFYKIKRKEEPSIDVIERFIKLVEGEEEDETN